jgi:hypothetical protein
MAGDRLTKAVQRLVCVAGGDPNAVRLPKGTKPVRIRVYNAGPARVVVVEPRRPNGVSGGRGRFAAFDPEGDVVASGLAGNGEQEVCLRGTVTQVGDGTWLTSRGGWSIPLVLRDEGLAKALDERAGRQIRLRGFLHEVGFIVSAVLDATTTSS